MTTIAANTEYMASDSQATGGGVKTSVDKFWRIRGWLIAASGTYSDIVEVLDEIRDNKEKSPLEVFRTTKFGKVDCNFILLSPAGKLYMSEDAGTPWKVKEGFAAIGSGQQGAMVALYMGATPTEAVRVVRKVDPYTGGRVITRKLT